MHVVNYRSVWRLLNEICKMANFDTHKRTKSHHEMREEQKIGFFPSNLFLRQLFCRKISHKRPIILWETQTHTHIHQNNIQQMLMATMRNPIANTHYTQTKRVDHDIEKFNTSLNKFEFGSYKTDTCEFKQSIISSLFLPATPNANRLLCFLFV